MTQGSTKVIFFIPRANFTCFFGAKPSSISCLSISPTSLSQEGKLLFELVETLFKTMEMVERRILLWSWLFGMRWCPISSYKLRNNERKREALNICSPQQWSRLDWHLEAMMWSLFLVGCLEEQEWDSGPASISLFGPSGHSEPETKDWSVLRPT